VICREFYGQDDMERPDLFNQIFQIAVMGDNPEIKEWCEDFAMDQLFCGKTYGEAKKAASKVLMVKSACVSHRCEQNEVYRFDPITKKPRCVCHPGRACNTSGSQSTVGIVLAALILLLIFLLWATTVWDVLRNTRITSKRTA